MQKLVSVFGGIILFSSTCFSQTDTTDYVGQKKIETPYSKTENTNKPSNKPAPTPFEDKLFTGGNLALNFGTYTFIEVSPVLGYRFTEKFQGGVGIIYNYFSDNNLNYSTSIYGPRVFVRAFIFKQLYGLAEAQIISREAYIDNRLTRILVSALPVGLGYRQFLGPRAAFDIQLMYDMLFNEYSINPRPLYFRTGINFNFGY